MQSAPPAFSIFLHYLAFVSGYGNLALRLPALTFAFGTCACVFGFLRRSMNVEAGVFAAAHCLLVLSFFAVQVRPYTMVACCYAAAVWLWSTPEHRNRGWRIVGIGLLLVAAIALHFYAVLLVPAIGFLELWRSWRARSLRLDVWCMLLIAGASIFLWNSVMVPTRQLVRQDVLCSTHFGLFPQPVKLLLGYAYLFLGAGNPHTDLPLGAPAIFLLLCLIFAAAAGVWRRFSGQAPAAVEQGLISADARIAILGSLLLPLIVFLFAVFVSKAFSIRYLLAAGVGVSGLLAMQFCSTQIFRRALPFALCAEAALLCLTGIPANHEFDHTRIYPAIPGRDPIVVADGRQFFNLIYSAPAEFRSRLVYLELPAGVPTGDAMNAHIIARCKTVLPQLPVADSSVFLARQSGFWVLDERTADDTPASYLLARDRIALWGQIDDALIYRSVAPPGSVSYAR